MSDLLYRTSDAKKSKVGHLAGHRRLGPSFSKCGKRLSSALPPRFHDKPLCQACAAEREVETNLDKRFPPSMIPAGFSLTSAYDLTKQEWEKNKPSKLWLKVLLAVLPSAMSRGTAEDAAKAAVAAADVIVAHIRSEV